MYVLVPVENDGHHHFPASAGDCPNPECPQWGVREAVGTFATLAEADTYRLRMHDPEGWMLARVLLRDTDRDWCEEGVAEAVSEYEAEREARLNRIAAVYPLAAEEARKAGLR